AENELPGSVPYVHVANTDEAFQHAIKEGAEPVVEPETMMPGVRIALVKAPGGCLVGFSGPSEIEAE
ncbi:MAG: hypothetical protein R3C44_21480, partial [Chloroflexota bacterium]